MIESIPSLPLKQGVIALLEDFRPKRLRLSNREKRSDLYVYRDSFRYVLQRLCAPQYAPGDGIHIVAFDHANYFQKLDQYYRVAHGQPWILPWGGEWPSLLDCGYSESLAATHGGPLNEIADLVVGTVTRWAACRCGAERGREFGNREELDRACQAVLDLFPSRGSIPDQWTGWSFVVFTKDLAGKEQLKAGLDGWLQDLKRESVSIDGDGIPF
jgi:hypothetical protein